MCWVFIALGNQHAMRMRHIVIRGLPGCTVFFYIISLTARILEKNKLLYVECLFRFSLQIFPKYFSY